MSTPAPTTHRPEERLVSLVVALLATDLGLTKDAILSAVEGYRQQRLARVSKDALEKMFERDKETLRSLGIPVQTIGDWADPDDLRNARYRIPAADYALPEDVSFSPAEIALLNLAGGVWSESSLSADARSALRKIRALGGSSAEPIIGYAPRISLHDPSFADVQRGIEQCRQITFSYLKPGDKTARLRRINPLALLDYESRWHLFGIDTEIAEDRTFLLSRIVGKVTVTRRTFDAGLRDGAGERARKGLERVAARHQALLEVTPGTEAALRLSSRCSPATQGSWVHYVDAHIFADELASYGPEVRVVKPAALRKLVLSRLRGAVRAVGGRP